MLPILGALVTDQDSTCTGCATLHLSTGMGPNYKISPHLAISLKIDDLRLSCTVSDIISTVNTAPATRTDRHPEYYVLSNNRLRYCFARRHAWGV